MFSVRYLGLHQLYHKKHKILPNNPLIHININMINNRLEFKIKDVYKPEVQTTETIKLFGRSKKLIDKTKNAEDLPSLDVHVFLIKESLFCLSLNFLNITLEMRLILSQYFLLNFISSFSLILYLIRFNTDNKRHFVDKGDTKKF